ncbi:MAG TPA: serine hydrolase [Blastocatellia bacterium]|nr:serine hydrolase [Blastocatellia bacterium]
MKSRMKFLVTYCMLLCLASVPAARGQEAPLAGFDDYVNHALKDWEVPGLAIAIIKNDAIVLSKGYGVRKLGEQTPVNERTLFAIGSCSKAFTAASLAMLSDEGKLKWDDPATKHLAGFQLYDPYVTREMTVRDLLSHRLGLERGDFMWYGSNYNRDEIIRRVRFLKPTWSMRSRFGYQNIMYLAAGQIIPSITGKSWDDFARERIFTPLGMTDTNTSTNALKTADNVATPHDKFDEKVQPIAWRNIDNIGPAGSINSNVTDMAQWVRLQLGGGKYKNEQLISSGAVKEMHMSQTVIRVEGVAEKLNPETHFMNYGLGWFLQDYRGRKIIQHGGNIDGMSALVAMMPEEKLGLVILTNMDGTALPTAIMYRVFDAFLQSPQRDWSGDLLKVVRAQEALNKEAEKKMEESRVKGTSPSLEIAKYAGNYTNEMYGDAKVMEEQGKLVFHYGPLTADLNHWHYDTFQAVMRQHQLGKALVNFTLNAQGKVDEIRVVIPQAGDIPFKRAPEKVEAAAGVAMSEADLKKFVGKYELKAPPIEVSIEMVGGKLKGVIPGQPVATLVPVSATRFQIVAEGTPTEIFAQFEMAEGRAKSLTIEPKQGPKLVLTPKQ